MKLRVDFNALSNNDRNKEKLEMKYEDLKKNLKKKYTANQLDILVKLTTDVLK